MTQAVEQEHNKKHTVGPASPEVQSDITRQDGPGLVN